MLKVGITPYINAFPFHLGFQYDIDPQAEILLAPPSDLNRFLREGQLDIALISSFEYLKGNFFFLSPFGIGAKGKIHSVNLYFKTWSSHMICHVTEESATSVALLKVLAAHFWKISLTIKPLAPNFRENDCFLLIGNQALALQNLKNYTRVDLAEEWLKYTGQEFIFALFASHKKSEIHTNFCQKLQEALKWSEKNFHQIMAAAKKQSLHSPAFLQTYYQAHTYKLSALSFKGLNLFAKLLEHV